MVEIFLPLPVSVNKAYNQSRWGRGGRFKSKDYKDWVIRASKYLKEHYDLPLPSMDEKPIKATYTFYMPCWYKNGNHKKVDVANFEKVLSDFLVDNIKGFDDSWIYKNSQEKIDSDKMLVHCRLEYYEPKIDDSDRLI